MNLEDVGQFLRDSVGAGTERELTAAVDDFVRQGGDACWPLVCRWAPRSALLVHRRARNLSVELRLPSRMKRQLQFLSLRNLKQNEQFREAALELAAAFAGAGVRVIFFKGGAYLFTAYVEEPEVRSMADLDLLVPREDLSRAEDVMRSLGYREDYARLSRRQNTVVTRKFLLRRHFHLVYFRGALPVELHWDVGRGCHPRLSHRLFLSSVPVTPSGISLRVPGPAGTIFLCLYDFVRDEAKRSPWCWDLNASLEAMDGLFFFFHELDRLRAHYGRQCAWPQVLRLAALSGKQRQILIFLELARSMMGMELPRSVLTGIEDHPTVAWAGAAARRAPYHGLSRLLLAHRIMADRSRRALSPEGFRHYCRKLSALISPPRGDGRL
jgi:hypothetical protein